MKQWFLLLCLAAWPAFGEKPNVVILLADDLGWADVGYHGSEIQTPHLDQLARRSVQLHYFYVYPICSPTRAGLMTGRSAMRYGVIYSVIRPWANYGVPLDEHLLPQTFQAAGYQTAMIGKWHLGHANVSLLPTSRGFDHFYGHLNGAIDYYTHQRQGAVDWQRDGKTVHEEGYSTDLFAAEAVRIIAGRDRRRPLFLYVAFNAPHAPLEAPQQLVEKYATIQDKRRRIYAAMVDALDRAVGKILAALDQQGVADNTVVLFFSDNGGPLQQGARNHPLRGGKGSTFEGGIRVPAILRWPGGPRDGRKLAQVITNLDLLPTLAAAAGATPGNTKPLDGQNLWPAIREGKPAPREDLFWAVENDGVIHLAVRRQEWKLVRQVRKADRAITDYLFRVDDDPNETTDLAGKHPELVQELAAKIEKWQALHPPGCVEAGSAHPGWVAPKDWAAAAVR